MQVTLPWSLRWNVQCLPGCSTQNVTIHSLSQGVVSQMLLVQGGWDSRIRHLGTLISNKSGIQPSCTVVETSVTLLGSQVKILDSPREVNLLHRYALLHFADTELLVEVCKQVVQLVLVLFLACPDGSAGSWTTECTGSWAAHDKKSVQRAQNVPKHASNAHLQLHKPQFFPPFSHLATKHAKVSFHSTLARLDLLKFWCWMKSSSESPL